MGAITVSCTGIMMAKNKGTYIARGNREVRENINRHRNR